MKERKNKFLVLWFWNQLRTYEPAIITFLHHLHNVSLSQLQLVRILGFVVVNSFVSNKESTEKKTL